jgi:CubicO group peptidase (beta-lactamase class C family)
MELTRRSMLEATAGALCAEGSFHVSALPGPPLISAGLIARRGDGDIARQWVDGAVLRSGAPGPAFGFSSMFRVASVSKMVTAAGFMRLASEGAVDLDADVSAYLGAPLRHPAHPETAITARMLLSHTSGLRNGADFPLPFSAVLLERLSRAAGEPGYGDWFAPDNELPGEFFSYSDVNFGVIAQIIERVAGRRFDLYMREAVFAPLGLDIGYNWSGVGQAARDRVAPAARLRDGRWTAEFDQEPPPEPDVSLYRGDAPEEPRLAAYELGRNGLGFSPHGGLRVSLAGMDALARFFAHGDERVLGLDALRAMQEPAWSYRAEPSNGETVSGFYQHFGLGVHLPAGQVARDAFAAMDPDWRGHFGDAYGWMTGLLWNARSCATIVYALNGMPEQDRPQAQRSALTAPEEALVTMGLAALA